MIKMDVNAPPGSAARDLMRVLPDATLHGLRRGGSRARADLRAQAAAAFGRGLKGISGKPMRDTIFSKTDMGADGQWPMSVRVASAARYARRAGGPTDLLTVYSQGAFIVPTAGREWLAFPTENAPIRSGGKRRASPRDSYSLGGMELDFIRVNDRLALLVTRARNRAARKVMFVLLRDTRRRKVLDVDSVFEKHATALPGYVTAAIELALQRLGGAT